MTQPGAFVTSLDALERFRAALCAFQHEGTQALSSVQTEARRFAEWLKHDQLAYWRQEIRRREDLVAEAKGDLHRCLSATIDPRRTPSCLQEKKLLAIAKRRLEEAEAALASVRRWIPIVEQELFEFHARVEPLATSLANGVPRALADLDGSLARLAAYLETEAPPRADDANE